MARDTQELPPRDSGWINLEEPREVRYWTRALSVSEQRLRSAVRAAGDATSAVRQYLGGQHGDVDEDMEEADGSMQMQRPPSRSSPSGAQQQG